MTKRKNCTCNETCAETKMQQEVKGWRGIQKKNTLTFLCTRLSRESAALHFPQSSGGLSKLSVSVAFWRSRKKQEAWNRYAHVYVFVRLCVYVVWPRLMLTSFPTLRETTLTLAVSVHPSLMRSTETERRDQEMVKKCGLKYVNILYKYNAEFHWGYGVMGGSKLTSGWDRRRVGWQGGWGQEGRTRGS